MSVLTDEQLGQGWLFHERFGYAYDKIPPGLAFEAYGKAILMAANGDGTLAPEERDWVVGYFAAFDSPQQVIDDLKSYDGKGDIDAMLAMGNTVANEGRRWLIWDALNACGADGKVDAGEYATIERMAKDVGVSQDVVDQIFALYRDEEALRDRRMALLWPDGIPAAYR